MGYKGLHVLIDKKENTFCSLSCSPVTSLFFKAEQNKYIVIKWGLTDVKKRQSIL